jgi:DNA-directed RNA polymerase specialized sigma subunit
MDTKTEEQMLALLQEIRDLLKPISACHEEQYQELQTQQTKAKIEALKPLLTSVRQKIFRLLFDSKHLSQVEIAKKAGTTQPTVSRFISMLMDMEIIEPDEDDNGNVFYKDKYNLANNPEVLNE